MSTGTAFNPAGPLAPSELVLLRGEQFASKALLGNVQLLHSDESVSASKLGEAILAAAFLACHQAGSIRLEVRQKKALLGLRKVDRLCATPGDPSVTWPAASLEGRIGELARQYAEDDDHEVRNLVYGWLAQDSVSPWQAAIDRIKAGLAERGLLDRFDETRLKIFTVTRYELPPATGSLAAEQPLEPVHGLLEGCARERPEIWKLLTKELRAAISARTEQSDTDD
jgi:hypothetical protein